MIGYNEKNFISDYAHDLEGYKKAYIALRRFLISNKYLAWRFDKTARKYKFKESVNAGIAVWGYGIKEVCPQEIFLSSTTLSFENHFFTAPKDYDTYLSRVYGNYLKLPPKEKRVSHHHFMAGIKKGYHVKEIIREVAEPFL